MYIIIDNYDSFTYNIYQYLSLLTDKPIKVFRNDTLTISQIKRLKPDGIIISPGPGRPETAGVSLDIVAHFAGKIPILGICLGHQVIGQAFGASITRAKRIVHGKVDEIKLDGKGLFRNIPPQSKFTRYHSLIIDKQSLSNDFEISAVSLIDGQIMGIRHKKYILEGIQFHPESIASKSGKKILENFISYKRQPFKTKDILEKLIKGESLSELEAESFMDELTSGNLTSAQIAAILVALSAKGVSHNEIAGCAKVLKKKALPFPNKDNLIDTCGTGGDGKNSFNISSMAAIVAASCGAKVAKHGNRAISSACGSADFYSALGLNINIHPKKAEQLLNKCGFTFLFAPIYHSAMRFAAPVRAELAIKTIMNLIGPLSNPAGASYQLIGVYDKSLCMPIAKAAKLLGVKRVMVVSSENNMDEISICVPTNVVEIGQDNIALEYKILPEAIIGSLFADSLLKGGSANENAIIAKQLMFNKAAPAIREAVLLNSAAALYISGFSPKIKSAYKLAKKALENGVVKEKFEQILSFSNTL